MTNYYLLRRVYESEAFLSLITSVCRHHHLEMEVFRKPWHKDKPLKKVKNADIRASCTSLSLSLFLSLSLSHKLEKKILTSIT